jgi:hypothetical protein
LAATSFDPSLTERALLKYKRPEAERERETGMNALEEDDGNDEGGEEEEKDDDAFADI